jgi:hypothetical protein
MSGRIDAHSMSGEAIDEGEQRDEIIPPAKRLETEGRETGCRPPQFSPGNRFNEFVGGR